VDDERFDPGLLDEEDPFEVDTRPRHGDSRRCRPIGCYEASQALAVQYRKDRRR